MSKFLNRYLIQKAGAPRQAQHEEDEDGDEDEVDMGGDQVAGQPTNGWQRERSVALAEKYQNALLTALRDSQYGERHHHLLSKESFRKATKNEVSRSCFPRERKEEEKKRTC
jgi:hypothetical protein